MSEPPSETPETVPFGAEDVPVAEKSGRVRRVFESVAARYDLMNDLMSGGAHRLWKTAAVDVLMPRPWMRVADVAGGTGDMAIAIAHRAGGPGTWRAAGGSIAVIDVNREMLARAKARIRRAQLADVIAVSAGDAEALPLDDGTVDAYVIAFGLRNVTDPARALAEARRVLAPGGRFVCLEFSRPVWPLMEPVYRRYSDAVLPRLGRLVAGDADAYRYLAESIRRFPAQDALAAMMRAAGLERVAVRNLAGGIAAIHSAWRI